MLEGALTLVTMVVIAAVALGLVRVSRWARENPNPTHEIADPDTDISEDEWSNAIK